MTDFQSDEAMADAAANPPEAGGADSAADSYIADIEDVFGLSSSDDTKIVEGSDEDSDANKAPVGTGSEEEGDGQPDTSSSTPPAQGQEVTKEAQPAAGTPSPTPTPAEPAKVDPEVALLKANYEALQKRFDAMQTEPKGDKEEAGTAKPAAGTPDEINHRVQLPQEVLAQLFGDDPAAATGAMNGIVSGLMTSVHRTVRAEMLAMKQELQQEIGGITTSQTTAANRATQQKMQEDYFAAFPEHNKPVYQSMLATEAAQLVAENPSMDWNDTFRDALGARMNKALSEMGVVLKGGTPTTPPATPTPKPAAFVDSGTRRDNQSGDNDDIISETFSSFGG